MSAHHRCLILSIAIMTVCLPNVHGLFGSFYPSRTYYYASSRTYYYQTQSSTVTLVDQTIYTNYVTHCADTPAYSMNYNERYLVYGSVPIAYDASSPFVDNNGNPLSNYLTSQCSFSLSGPSGYQLLVTFQDQNCNGWPSGCSLTVYNGNYYSDSSAATLMTLPSTTGGSSTCTQQYQTSGNTVSLSVQQCNPNPSSSFNFTLTIVAKNYSNGYYSTSVYAAFSALAVALVIVAVVIRCCCGPRRIYCPCCPPPTLVTQIYPAQEQTVVYTTSMPVMPVPPDQQHRSQLVIQPDGRVMKYEQDENGVIRMVAVNAPPPYPEVDHAAPPPYTAQFHAAVTNAVVGAAVGTAAVIATTAETAAIAASRGAAAVSAAAAAVTSQQQPQPQPQQPPQPSTAQTPPAAEQTPAPATTPPPRPRTGSTPLPNPPPSDDPHTPQHPPAPSAQVPDQGIPPNHGSVYSSPANGHEQPLHAALVPDTRY